MRSFRIHIENNKKSLLIVFLMLLLLIPVSAIYKTNNHIVHATNTEDEYVLVDAKPDLILLSEINKSPENRDPNAVNSYSNPYIISGVVDFYILQEFSKYNSCEGMYFKVNSDLQGKDPFELLQSENYDGSDDDDSEDEEDDNSSMNAKGVAYHIDLIRNCDPDNPDPDKIKGTWYGIGVNFCYPFKGYIDFCGIKVRTNTSIFGFLGDGAVVKDLKVFGDITNEKNLEYYKQWNSSLANAHIGGIATIAYIKDEDGKNNSITVANCSVTDSSTITAISSTPKCSVGGIIGACYGLNKTYGSKQTGAVNFNITGCYVDAKISCVGTQYEANNAILGNESRDGKEKNADGVQVIKKSNVTTKNIIADTYGYAGGLIGAAASTGYGKYYINVNVGAAVNPNVPESEKAEYVGTNSVYGSVTASNSSAGGAIGHVADRVFVTFSKGLSFHDGEKELTSINSKNAIDAEAYYSGLLVGSARYALIITTSDFSLTKNDGTKESPTQIARTPYAGNGVEVAVPANVYINPNMSDRFQGTGGWTKTVRDANESESEPVELDSGVIQTTKKVYEYTYNENDAYILSEPNDFVMLSIYLSTNGNFGEEFFGDTTNRRKNEDRIIDETATNGKITETVIKRKDAESALQYARKATYVIDRNINISNTGINSINRHRSIGFSGKLIGKIDAEGNKPLITFNRDTYQDDTGLFYSITPMTGTTVEFRDFDITGNISGRGRVSGISQEMYFSSTKKSNKSTSTYNSNNYYPGNILFENIDNSINISYKYNIKTTLNSPYISMFIATDMYYNEAGVGEEFVDIPTIEFNDLSYSGNVLAGQWYYGSLFGIVYSPNNQYGYKLKIDINDFLLGKENKQPEEENSYIKHDANCSTGYIGGLIGYVSRNGAVNYATFGSSGTVKQDYYAERTQINIKNYRVKNVDMGVSTDASHNLGGYIAHSLYGVELNVKDISVEDCNVSIPTGSYGGLVYLFSHGSVANFDGINYNGFNIEQRIADNTTNIGGIFGGKSGNYNEALINIKNYNITDCTITGTNRFSDVGARNMERNTAVDGHTGDNITCAIVNLISDEYSLLNPYKHRFAYKENRDSTPITDYKKYRTSCCIIYNAFTSDKFNATTGSSDKEDYIIKGEGTKESPFIIDSPEKMMVMQMVSLVRFRSKIELFGEYFEFVNIENYGSTTLCKQKRDATEQLCEGYYVFSNNIDLTGYSFIALTARAGSYYGFRADDYLTALQSNVALKRLELMYANVSNAATMTDDDVLAATVTKAQVISHAIDILSRDQDIIEDYESAYEDEYEIYVAEKKAESDDFSFSYSDKLIVTQRLKNKNDNDTKNKVAEYELLTEYKKYKPQFTFDAKGIDDVGKNSGYDYLKIGVRGDDGKIVSPGFMYMQVRWMHSGLFTNLYKCTGERKVYINNIKLEGTFGGALDTVYDLTNGGALISNVFLDFAIRGTTTANSEVDIRNISFGNVSTMHHASSNPGTLSKGAGLLIDGITEATVDIYDIKIEEDANVSADALIGYQTGDKTKVVFEHIDLNEAISFNDDDTFNSSKLRYGLLYYNCNLGLSVYYYDAGDFDATWINTDIITPGKSDINGERRVEKYEYRENIPYALGNTAVEINPTTNHILLGNGTKDDPFVIENVGQMTALYQAFKGLGELADQTTWFVGDTSDNPDGFDPEDSSTWVNYRNYVTWNQTDDESKRKEEMEYLRSAYYVIVDDIDFYNVPIDSSYKMAATDFSGLGIETFPFSGSFDGSYKYVDKNDISKGIEKRNVNEENVKIILNDAAGQQISQYGFIKYADGVNISNLNFCAPEDTDTDYEGDYIPVRTRHADVTYYGMAIARVIGGDSVMDNVTASGWMWQSYDGTWTGGLVGEVNCGTVTFTNMKKDAVKNFRALSSYVKGTGLDNKSFTSTERTNTRTKAVGGYVGRVQEAGICFYDVPERTDSEGNAYKDMAVKNTYNDITQISSDLYENTVGYPAARVDRAYLINKAFLDGEKIEVTGKASTGYTAFIRNEKQLYILSLAIRCGALSPYANNTKYRSIADLVYFPYGYYAKTYKTYDDNNDDDTTIVDDRASYNSAVFEYFDFSDIYYEQGATFEVNEVIDGNNVTHKLNGVGAMIASTGTSMLNQYSADTIAHEKGAYRTTYTLNEDDVYDMIAPTVDGDEDTIITDFRGIGPRAGLSNNLRYNFMTFSSDFNGNNSEIKYSCKNANATDTRSGLFNVFYPTIGSTVNNTKNTSLKIYDVVLSGSIQSGSTTSTDIYYDTKNSSAGALLGYCYNNNYIEISNVKVKNFSITANKESGKTTFLYAGGLIGMSGAPNLSLSNITIGDSDMSDAQLEANNKKYSVVIYGNSGNITAGGLCGYVREATYKNITVQNTCLTGSGSGNIGGIIGRFVLQSIKYNYFDCITITNSNISSSGAYVGGIIGNLYKVNSKYSLSGREIYFKDTEIKVDRYPEKEGQLIGYQSSDNNGNGSDEAGFVDVKWEYTEGLDIYKTSKVWTNVSAKSEYFIINKLKDIEEVEKEYNISGGVNDVYEALENEDSSGEESIQNAKRYSEIIVTDRIAKSDKSDRDYMFKYDSGETDENGDAIYLPTDLVPKSIFDKDNDGVADFEYDGINDIDNILVEWDTSAGSIEMVLNDVLNTLTNGTGLLNQGKTDENGETLVTKNDGFSGNPNDNISVKVIPMQVIKGEASERPEGTVASVSIVPNATTGLFDVINTNQYDKVEKENQPGTYSLIEISYGVSVEAVKNGVGFVKKIYIPFMVCNMIKTDTYATVVIGENYNTEELHKGKNRKLEVTKDSSFTLYTEILYSKNRGYFPKDAVIRYKKEFVLDKETGVDIPVGTKLTLLDTTDGISKIYYYEVKDPYKKSVKFTEFKDDDGNPYVERNIRNYDDLKEQSRYLAMANVYDKVITRKKFGVEIFTIFVDLSATENSSYTSSKEIWVPMVVDTCEYASSEISTEEYFIKTEKVFTYLNTFDTRDIGFDKTAEFEEYRISEKKISKTENLNITTKIYNRASPDYWNNLFENGFNVDEELRVEGSLNDYANKDKYLEVCLSLVNSEGEKILFPAGTKVRIGYNDKFEGIKSTSQIYYYKDSGSLFELDNKDRFELVEVNETDGTFYVQHLEDLFVDFNFANARLETLPAGTYSIEMELLRTSNNEYPMGSEVLDRVVIENINVTANVEYGFSISDYDKADLSYNKKDETKPYSLTYSLKLSSSFEPELTADKTVLIKYQLLKKNVVTGTYEPLAQNIQGGENGTSQTDCAVQIKIGDFSDTDSGKEGYIGDLSGTGYRIVKGNQVIEEGDTQSGTPGIIDLTNTSDTFASDMQSIIIKDVPSSEDGILSIPFTVDMPEDADAVNYKIVASLYSEEKNVKEAEDMVIFNISDIELY